METLEVECSDVWGRVGMRKRENTQSFMGFQSCICSENAFQLQANIACKQKAHFMEIETVWLRIS